jgi:hypothetical protein
MSAISSDGHRVPYFCPIKHKTLFNALCAGLWRNECCFIVTETVMCILILVGKKVC